MGNIDLTRARLEPSAEPTARFARPPQPSWGRA